MSGSAHRNDGSASGVGGEDRNDGVVVIVMGASGAGKSTVGRRLADALGWAFVEGDTLHPAANVDKMRAGIALTDAERTPWLTAVRARIARLLAAGESAVIACSALRRGHRAMLRVDPARVRFVYLRASPSLLRGRLETRSGHFMPGDLLDSQLETLEEPRDALVVDAALPLEEVVSRLHDALA